MDKRFPALVANEELCAYFTGCARSSSLSHAYILLGAKGTGKHTLARLIAAAVSCEHRTDGGEDIPCGACNSCRKICEGISPDVTVIGRSDKATLGVDAIRFIKGDIASYPIDGDYKIYIIEDAHTMTKQAQNALLLTLEEPPSYVIFILLCESTEPLLDTIKSRAPVLRMKTPSEAQTIEYFKKNNSTVARFIESSPEEFKEIYKASSGSIGRIIELIGSAEKKQILGNRALATSLIEALSHKTLARDFSEILSMFAQKREERERLTVQFLEIEAALRDLIAIKKADDPAMVFFTDTERAEELSYGFSILRLTQIIECTEKTRLAITRNANVKLTLVNYLSNLI